MDTSRLAELLKGAKEDYSQLADAYPNAAKFVNALRGNIEQNVPTQADFQNPQAMADWSQAAALNAPMGLTTKFAKAHEIAQRNAALPVEQGGLGLPANNTAMDRAKAMGFDTPAYHGTNADIEIFNIKGKGKTSGGGAFLTDNPLVAETYVSAGEGGNILPVMIRKDNLLDVNARGKNWSDIWTDNLGAKSKGKKYSLNDLELDKNSVTTTDELAQIAPELGLNGVIIKNVKDLGPNSHIFRAKEYLNNKYGIVPDEIWSNVTGKQFAEAKNYMDKLYNSQKSNITALQKPSDIRSRFAAFDPMQKNSPNLLAGGALGALLLNQEYNKGKK